MNPEVGVWCPNTFYAKDAIVRSPAAAYDTDGRALVQSAQSHRSGATFDATEKALWTRLDSGSYAAYVNLARNPDLLIVGTVTRDSNGAATSAPVVWPDGTVGTYTADTVSTAFPGAVDGYHITYGSPATRTYTQPTITRDAASGAATAVPAIVVT